MDSKCIVLGIAKTSCGISLLYLLTIVLFSLTLAD